MPVMTDTPIVIAVPGPQYGGTYRVSITPAGAIVYGPDIDPQQFQIGAQEAMTAADPEAAMAWSGQREIFEAREGYFADPSRQPETMSSGQAALAAESQAAVQGVLPGNPQNDNAGVDATGDSDTPPKPGWIAVVPVLSADGKYTLDRQGDWAHLWLANGMASGTNLIEVVPDDADAPKFTDAALSDPNGVEAGTAVQSMMHHIGAPAMVLVIFDQAAQQVSVSYYWEGENTADQDDQAQYVQPSDDQTDQTDPNAGQNVDQPSQYAYPADSAQTSGRISSHPQNIVFGGDSGFDDVPDATRDEDNPGNAGYHPATLGLLTGQANVGDIQDGHDQAVSLLGGLLDPGSADE